MRSISTTLQDLLPKLERCNNVPLSSGDVLIHAPGFEDRTMGITILTTSKGGAFAALLAYLPANNPNNRLSDVSAELSNKGIQIPPNGIIDYNRFEPGDFEDRLRAYLISIKATRAVIDISTMSKLQIMLVLNCCRDINLHVKIIYFEAEFYAPTAQEFERCKAENKVHQPTLQIFTSVHGVVRVNSLASVAMQGQPTAAIVFMSFNDILTQSLLNTVYPSRLFLINGRPPVHKWREEAVAWIHDQVRQEWGDDNPITNDENNRFPLPTRSISTLHYEETVFLLLQLYWELSSTHRLLLAPAGSKMQAVGCYLVKALHPDIHIEYPCAEGFAKEYSSGIGSCWSIDFGDINHLIQSVRNAERKEYLQIPI